MVEQIVWTVKAKNDLTEILQYWNNRNKSKSFGIKLNSLIFEQLNLLKQFPLTGRKTDIKNVFVKVIHRYLLYYELIESTLYILTIQHQKQYQKKLK